MVSISYAGLASFLSEVFRVTFFVYDLIIEGVLVFILGGCVMAMCKSFNCNKCGKSISSWDDGNPYYFDEQGVKQYA